MLYFICKCSFLVKYTLNMLLTLFNKSDRIGTELSCKEGASTMKGLLGNRFVRLVLVGMVTATAFAFGTWSLPGATPTSLAASNSCHINSPQGNIQHVISIQFDNTHFTRDNP